jgi:glycosyltransferase involved in cell wall biosynthesis
VDHFAAISHYIARRIKKIYGREAEVIYPPVDTDLVSLEEKKEDYFLTVSRLVPYKRIDLIVDAFSHCPDKRLVVIGDGPEMDNVKRKAGKNIEILGYQSDEIVRAYVQKARGFIFAAEEDFGIAPIEAQAAGTPVVAFGKGGALETVISEKTGIFFDGQTVSSMMHALERFENIEWDPVKIRENALRFNKQRFQRELETFVQTKIEAFYESHYLGRG